MEPPRPSNLSNHLGEVGRREEALTAIQESVGVRRPGGGQPAAWLPDLARSLNNLSIRLGEVGRWEEAVPSRDKAAEAHAECRRQGWARD